MSEFMSELIDWCVMLALLCALVVLAAIVYLAYMALVIVCMPVVIVGYLCGAIKCK